MVKFSTNYHFIYWVWTPTFSIAEPIPVAFPPAFPKATDENTKCQATDGCQVFAENSTQVLL